LAKHSRSAGTGSASEDRVGDQAAIRLAPPDFVFAFHDDDEIGPRMLARIAKRTGLRPEDL